LLKEVVSELKSNKIRVSLFVSPSIETLENLSDIMADRVELYTFNYAKNFLSNNEDAIRPYKEVSNFLQKNFPDIELNAGHDLNLINLKYFLSQIPTIQEVSIGHAIVCDTFDFGLEQTIKKYLSLANN